MANKYRKHSHALFIWIYVSLLIGVVVCLSACGRPVTPRPDGYFRIESYPQSYRVDTIGRITLQVNDSAQSTAVENQSGMGTRWLNIFYPRYHATLYLSYIPVISQEALGQLLGEGREFVYRQNVNTAAVEAIAYENPEQPLFATLYTLSAESATPLQFIATDSAEYLLRGVLYYDSPVRTDSVAPTLEYLETEIIQMIESISKY